MNVKFLTQGEKNALYLKKILLYTIRDLLNVSNITNSVGLKFSGLA